jgi:non-ribosomal peptide synthetase component F
MDSERVSAGFTVLNVWDRICDQDGGELPNYAVGELYVGGAGVAIGYFHNDELTAERFPTVDGERYCNTGDLAYRDDDGEVFVLGRNDGMIKLHLCWVCPCFAIL